MHAHMFGLSGAYMIADTPEKMLAYMDRANVRFAVFAGHGALFEGPVRIPDDLAVAKRYPDRFRLYHPVISPLCDPAADIGRFAGNDEYIGFKFLCDYYKTKLSDKKHTSYWKYMNENSLPALVHTWGKSEYDGISEAEKILDMYPDMSFMAGHSFYGDWDEAVRLAVKYRNLYLELTAVLPERGWVEKFIDAGLTRQIVFGTDAPWYSYEACIGALLAAEISEDDRRNILYQNACGILFRAGRCHDLLEKMKDEV